MSSNNDTTVFIPSSIMITLEIVKVRFIRQLPIIFMVLGSIGFIGNAFTFLQPNLRRNTFCIYSLCGSIADIVNLSINLLPNYIYATDNILALITDTQSCKWKLVALVCIPQLSMNFLILSLIDRYICTCPMTSPLRKLQQLKVVPYLILITMIISCVMSLYAPLLYEAIPGFGCTPINTLVNGVSYIIVHGFVTPLAMLLFVWLTYRNVKQSRQRVGGMENATTNRSRYPFIRTVFTQVITTSFLVLQWIAFYIYHISTQYDNKSVEQWTIHYFVLSLTNSIYYLINVKSFYLSTLTSRLFRETLIRSLLKLVNKHPAQQLNTTRLRTITNTVR